MNKLTDILNQELDSFSKFLTLLDNQHRQIVDRSLTDLNKTNSEIDLLSQETRILEKRRIEEVRNISRQLKLNQDNLNLGDLLPRLDSITSNRLQQLREAIHAAHKNIEEKSGRNKLLIEKSRKLIFESMKIMSSRPSPVYDKPGPIREGIHKSSLINRSV